MTSISSVKGDQAELKLAFEIKQRGMHVAEPLGADCPYDLIVDAGDGNIKRVQLKACFSREKDRDSYRVNATFGSKRDKMYSKKECDVFAVYVQPLDRFYFIPVGELKGSTVRVYPDTVTLNYPMYEKFYERWSILYE